MDNQEVPTNDANLPINQSPDESPSGKTSTSAVTATRESSHESAEADMTPQAAGSGTSTAVPRVIVRLLAHNALQNVYAGQFDDDTVTANTNSASAGVVETKIEETEECPSCYQLLSSAADINNVAVGVPGAMAYHSPCKNFFYTACLDHWAGGRPFGTFVTCPMCRGRQRAPKYSFMDPSAAEFAAGRARWGAFAAANMG